MVWSAEAGHALPDLLRVAAKVSGDLWELGGTDGYLTFATSSAEDVTYFMQNRESGIFLPVEKPKPVAPATQPAREK